MNSVAEMDAIQVAATVENGESSQLLATDEQHSHSGPSRRHWFRKSIVAVIGISCLATMAVLIRYPTHKHKIVHDADHYDVVGSEGMSALSKAFVVAPEDAKSQGQCGHMEEGVDYVRGPSWGGLVGLVLTPDACCDKCFNKWDCRAWSWSKERSECWVSGDVPTAKANKTGFVSGTLPSRSSTTTSTTATTTSTSSTTVTTTSSSTDASHPTRVKVLTYNLFWWNLFMQRHGNGGSASKLIRKAGIDHPFDIMGFQECVDPKLVLKEAGLLEQYDTIRYGKPTMTNNLCIAYKKSTWSMISKGQTSVGEDTHAAYYGKRFVQWTRLQHKKTNQIVFFMDHQGPLPINSGGVGGGTVIAANLLEQIKLHSQSSDAVILLGDLNADESSETMRTLEKHLNRVFTGEVNGGIDHIFSSMKGMTKVSSTNLGKGGSDHDALSVTLEIEPSLPRDQSATDAHIESSQGGMSDNHHGHHHTVMSVLK